MSPSRRQVLHAFAAAGTASLAGCLFGFGSDCVHSGSLALTEATTERIAKAYATDIDRLGPLDEQTARAAVEGESPTIISTDETPDRSLFRAPIEVDGQYYRFTSTLESERTRTGYRFTLSTSEAVETAATAEETIAFDALPAVDRRALLRASLNSVIRKTSGSGKAPDGISFEVEGVLVYLDDQAMANSVLVPDPQYRYVSHEGMTIEISKTGTEPNVTVREFAVDAETVASSTEAFEAQMQSAYGVHVEKQSLSASQREIMDEAIAEEYGYDACLDDADTDGFEPLVRKIFDLDGDLRHASAGGPRLVEYDGSLYLASFSVAVA